MSGACGCRGVGPCPPGVPQALLAGHRTPGFCAACRLCVAPGKPLPQPQFPRSKGGLGAAWEGLREEPSCYVRGKCSVVTSPWLRSTLCDLLEPKVCV